MRAKLLQETGVEPTNAEIEKAMYIQDAVANYEALASTSDTARADDQRNVRVSITGASSAAFIAVHNEYDSQQAVDDVLAERRKQGSINKHGPFVYSKVGADLVANGCVVEYGENAAALARNIAASLGPLFAIIDGRAPFMSSLIAHIADRISTDGGGWTTVTINGNELHFGWTTKAPTKVLDLPAITEMENDLKAHNEAIALKRLVNDPTLVGLREGATKEEVEAVLANRDVKAGTVTRELGKLKGPALKSAAAALTNAAALKQENTAAYAAAVKILDPEAMTKAGHLGTQTSSLLTAMWRSISGKSGADHSKMSKSETITALQKNYHVAPQSGKLITKDYRLAAGNMNLAALAGKGLLLTLNFKLHQAFLRAKGYHLPSGSSSTNKEYLANCVYTHFNVPAFMSDVDGWEMVTKTKTKTYQKETCPKSNQLNPQSRTKQIQAAKQAMKAKLEPYMKKNYAQVGDDKKRVSRQDILNGIFGDGTQTPPAYFMDQMKKLGYIWNQKGLKGAFVGLEPST